tara:strand:+ start:816 stop:1004 length:189 start_codon:yes stop_codon:yes gene_type:complete
MSYGISKSLIKFLNNELGLKDSSIQLGIKLSDKNKISLPLALWSYSLISTEELDKIYKFIWS